MDLMIYSIPLESFFSLMENYLMIAWYFLKSLFMCIFPAFICTVVLYIIVNCIAQLLKIPDHIKETYLLYFVLIIVILGAIVLSVYMTKDTIRWNKEREERHIIRDSITVVIKSDIRAKVEAALVNNGIRHTQSDIDSISKHIFLHYKPDVDSMTNLIYQREHPLVEGASKAEKKLKKSKREQEKSEKESLKDIDLSLLIDPEDDEVQ